MNDETSDVERRTNGMALVSLTLGILGFLVLPILASIAGIICGVASKRSIERSEGREGGRELAVAGIVLSSVGLAVWSGLLLFGFGIDALQSIF
ncbi:MAG: DUF4190 domain-containing protein [Actinomycetota bacterium]